MNFSLLQLFLIGGTGIAYATDVNLSDQGIMPIVRLLEGVRLRYTIKGKYQGTAPCDES